MVLTLSIPVAQNLQTIIMQQIQDLQKGKGGIQDPNKRPQYQKGPMGPSPFGSPQSNSPGGGGNPNMVKNAQHTALTLLLASQMQQQQGGMGGGGGGGGGSGQMSPNNSSNNQALQNQQLLAALHAMSKGGNGGGGDQFLNGIPSNNGPNLTNLLGLASPNNGISPLSPQQMDGGQNGIPHGYYPSHGGVLLSPGANSQASNGSNNGSMKDDQWAAFKSANRNTPSFGSNGLHKVNIFINSDTINL